MSEGVVVLVATPIGNLHDLSPRAAATLRDADVIAAEDTRRTRALLSHLDIPGGGRLRSLHTHNERKVSRELVEAAGRGARVAYVTDAGMPGISDPGARLVRAALDADIAVEVVPGPSAALTAVVLSGLPAGRFVFEGFLPRKGRARADRLDALAVETRTVVLYEAPHRVAATVAELAERLGASRPVAICRELTKVHEETWRGTLGEAASRLAAAEPRGEYVVVIGPPERRPGGVDEETVRRAVQVALEAGASARDASAEVAAELGVPKRLAYRLATELRSAD